jgi:hypothetical protein
MLVATDRFRANSREYFYSLLDKCIRRDVERTFFEDNFQLPLGNVLNIPGESGDCFLNTDYSLWLTPPQIQRSNDVAMALRRHAASEDELYVVCFDGAIRSTDVHKFSSLITLCATGHKGRGHWGHVTTCNQWSLVHLDNRQIVCPLGRPQNT